jgi:hypothetical protein
VTLKVGAAAKAGEPANSSAVIAIAELIASLNLRMNAFFRNKCMWQKSNIFTRYDASGKGSLLADYQAEIRGNLPLEI